MIIFAGIVSTLGSFGFEGAAGFSFSAALRIDAQRPACQVEKDDKTQQIPKKGGVHTHPSNTLALWISVIRDRF